ncbi:MAG TPA: EAL domain-containing protein [Thermoanaerobaculia bacterium]|jgi:diguanylate cyclase (GGDEF)-like protein|nr:EAL domain-containing protein [Thermoanaerobaculia bacterium]
MQWLRRFWTSRDPEASASRWVLAMTLLIGSCAAVTIAGFHRMADNWRQRQLLLAEVELLAGHLRLIETGAEQTPGRMSALEVRRSLNGVRARLAAADPRGDAAENVLEAAESYAADAEEQIRLRRAGRTAEADLWNDERSENSYEILLEAIYRGSGFYSAHASRALGRANVGSTVAIIIQALLIGLLVATAESRRRTNERRHAQLRHRALHDSLTGLANRELFYELLAHALSSAKRHERQIAVLYLDLDDFKQINDGLGHEVGDHLLVQVAQRLRSSVRTEDVPARLGGDEFVILTCEIERGTAAELAQRILARVQEPFQLAGQKVLVSASIGIAFATPVEASPEDLLHKADLAMYLAKSSGKGRFEIYESGIYRQGKEDLDSEVNFQYALEHEQFELYYQPILELATGNLVGAEVLVRWRDEVRRRLRMPADFLPFAERTGLILPLGRWILETACRQAHDWRQQFPLTARMQLSVNVPERLFVDSGLIEAVKHALAVSGLSGRQLILEIAEEVLLRNMDLADARLRALKGLGLRLAIDNFEGSYTTLGRLQHQVDMVHIHRSLVNNVIADAADSELIRGLIDLARRLHLQTLAEGIELEQQAVALRRMGCELGQGFYLSRPLHAAGFQMLISSLDAGTWRSSLAGDAPGDGLVS